MKYCFYTTSEKAWEGMFAAINETRGSIYLEMYIFNNDTKGFDFISALEKKAREGSSVVIVLDSFGSSGLTWNEIERLKMAGAEVLFFSFWFRRLHRKILIAGEYVFLGGVNIAGRFAPWKDLQIRISSKRITMSALRSFARVYRECGGKNPALLEKAKERPLRKARLWFLEHGIGGKFLELRKHYEENISSATESIVFVTPDLVPRRWFVAALHEAVLRGVRVEIMIPKNTDHPILADSPSYYFLGLFARLGVSCFFLPEMTHAKIMLVDGKKATVGTQNLDTLSFDWNAEAGLSFETEDMIGELKEIIDVWKSSATAFLPGMYVKRWYDPILSLICRWF